MSSITSDNPYCENCKQESEFICIEGNDYLECIRCGTPFTLSAQHRRKAVRYNQDKLRVDLIPTELTEQVAKVFTFGANKYSANNWKGFSQEQQDEIIGSLLRHILEYQKGNKFDDESGLHHLAHAACNIAFILYFENKKGELK